MPKKITRSKEEYARGAVRNALKNGNLIRPKNCQRCGKIDTIASDGRSTIHAHHADYSRPLDVEWICAKCHRDETPLPKTVGAPVYGVRNGASKLNPELVRLIINSPLSGRKLAKIIGVHYSTVNRVRSGKRWLSAAPQPPTKGD